MCVGCVCGVCVCVCVWVCVVSKTDSSGGRVSMLGKEGSHRGMGTVSLTAR